MAGRIEPIRVYGTLSEDIERETHCPTCRALSRLCFGHERGEFMANRTWENVRGTAHQWGRFPDRPVISIAPSRDVISLIEPFVYVDRLSKIYAARQGMVLLGDVIPKPFWDYVGHPLRGPYGYATIIHESYVRTGSMPWRGAHKVFYNACRAVGMQSVNAKMLYWIMYHFGPRWGPKEDMGKSSGTVGRPTLHQMSGIERFCRNKPSLPALELALPIQFGFAQYVMKRR